jgi:hypothetical protein
LTNNAATDPNGCYDTGVRITWSADPISWGDGGSGTRTYTVLRSGTAVATRSYATTIYTDIGGTNNVIYTYMDDNVKSFSLYF